VARETGEPPVVQADHPLTAANVPSKSSRFTVKWQPSAAADIPIRLLRHPNFAMRVARCLFLRVF
jgi:hypothetical protein